MYIIRYILYIIYYTLYIIYYTLYIIYYTLYMGHSHCHLAQHCLVLPLRLQYLQLHYSMGIFLELRQSINFYICWNIKLCFHFGKDFFAVSCLCYFILCNCLFLWGGGETSPIHKRKFFKTIALHKEIHYLTIPYFSPIFYSYLWIPDLLVGCCNHLNVFTNGVI